MSYDKPSILLAELWERESKHGNVYYSGFWGNLSVALLRDGERPHPTRPDETITVWKLVAQERQPRPAAQRPPTSPPERDAPPAPSPPDTPKRWRASWRLQGAAATLPPRGCPRPAGAGERRDRQRPRRAGRRGSERPAAVLMWQRARAATKARPSLCGYGLNSATTETRSESTAIIAAAHAMFCVSRWRRSLSAWSAARAFPARLASSRWIMTCASGEIGALFRAARRLIPGQPSVLCTSRSWSRCSEIMA
jgi:hypothetical protein